jgi:hypothetical protein
LNHAGYHPGATIINRMSLTLPLTRASTSSAQGRRDALLDALADAGARHAAATPAVLLLHIAQHVRRRPDYDDLGLGLLERWVDDLRRQQPHGAALVIGAKAINKLIDRVVAAYDEVQP